MGAVLCSACVKVDAAIGSDHMSSDVQTVVPPGFNRRPPVRKRERRRVLAGMGFVAPAAIVIFAFMLYPLGYAAYLSFTKYNFVYDDAPEFIGAQNYVAAFQDPQFITSLKNTGVYTVAYLSAVLVLSFILALMLFRKLKAQSFYRSAIFVPIVVPLSLAGLIFVWLLQPNYGLVNHVLGNILGFNGATRAWLSEGGTAMAAIVIVSLWATIGFMTILFLAGLQSIPAEILEAAEVDGATGWKKTFRVIIPNMRQTFLLTGIWASLQALKVFIEPMVLTDGGPGNSTLVIYQQIYKTAFNYFDMGYASAMGFILGGIIMLVIGLNYVIVRKKD